MAPDTLVAPAYLWVPDHTSTSGDEAADLADSVGMHLDGEQRLALDAIFAERADGKWAAFEAAVICARQNLKTYLLEVVALADLFLFDARLVIWTAHLFPTTMEAFRDLLGIIQSNPHLDRRVKNICHSNGDEGIELVGGGRLLFKARSASGGRGLTGDRVILDEAFKLSASEMGALLPTLSARPNPQVIYASSAGQLGSDVLRSVRDRGRPGGDPSLAYIEWAAPVVGCEIDRCDHRAPVPGCALDDTEAWRKANPAMGRRISVEHIAAERRALPPEEFARERLGWWEEPASAVGGLPAALWSSAVLSTPADGAVLGFAVDVMPDSSWSSVARVTGHAGGAVVELVAHRRGTSWVGAEVATQRGESKVPVALDMAGAASVVAPDLQAEGIEPVAPSGRDVAQGCAALLDGLIRNSVFHRDQPDLNAAVAGAVRRPLGDAWAWSRKSSLVDISPLVAATLALWASMQAPGEVEPWFSLG